MVTKVNVTSVEQNSLMAHSRYTVANRSTAMVVITLGHIQIYNANHE
jgi:hypothetical protein